MAETWILNEGLDLTGNASYIASFTCNGTVYAGIRTTTSVVTYLFNTTQMGGQRVYTRYGWDNEVYRTIVFDESPSGTLLTWLQRNGTKQVEPEPTTPKHACLIDGTVYSIKGGKTLISGTGYGIENGKTLIDGVGYNISLAKKLSVDIQGTFTYSTVEVGGTSYTVAGVVKAKAQTQITVTASGDPRGIRSAVIYYNGRSVATGSIGMGTQTPATYSFSLETDTTITCTDHSGGRGNYATITITTS